MNIQITNHKSQTRGFTLIELLVVISIIGILAAIALVSFTTAQRQAKDTQRKSDLSQYRTTLETFAQKNTGLYPASATQIAISAGNLCTYLGLSGCSLDPNTNSPGFANTSQYQYCTDTNVSDGSAVATNFVLWAALDNVPGSLWTVCSDGRSMITKNKPACGVGFNCFP